MNLGPPSPDPILGPEFLELGITPAEVTGVRKMPDHYQELRQGQLLLRMYATHLSTSKLAPHWLVVADSPTDRNIVLALRVGDDLTPDLGRRDPLGMLGVLTDRFGMDIKAGNRSGRLIALATIPASALSPTEANFQFTFQASADVRPSHRVRLFAFQRIDPEFHFIEIALLFYLNLTLYGKYLQGLSR